MLSETELVKLRPLEVEDSEAFYTWAGDREVTQFSLSSYAYPRSRSDIASWLAGINDSSGTFSFGICCARTGRLIGYTGLSSISSLNRCGEYFILIGDKEYWGRGYGTEVTRLITDYGFRTLGLHRIELTVFATNTAAIRAYEKSGYVKEGIKRQSGYRNGEFIDKVQMAILASEWRHLQRSQS